MSGIKNKQAVGLWQSCYMLVMLFMPFKEKSMTLETAVQGDGTGDESMYWDPDITDKTDATENFTFP